MAEFPYSPGLYKLSHQGKQLLRVRSLEVDFYVTGSLKYLLGPPGLAVSAANLVRISPRDFPSPIRSATFTVMHFKMNAGGRPASCQISACCRIWFARVLSARSRVASVPKAILTPCR